MSGSDRWNVGMDFTKIKVMRLLADYDDHITIAEFGTSNMTDEFQINNAIKNQARVRGLLRAITDLIMLIDNTHFCIDKKTKEEYLSYRTMLVNSKPVVKKCEKRIRNERDKSHQFKLNEEPFSMIIASVQDVHRVLLGHLDKANLIFRDTGQIDPDNYMKDLETEATVTG